MKKALPFSRPRCAVETCPRYRQEMWFHQSLVLALNGATRRKVKVHRFSCGEPTGKRHYAIFGPHGEPTEDLRTVNGSHGPWIRYMDSATGVVIEAHSGMIRPFAFPRPKCEVITCPRYTREMHFAADLILEHANQRGRTVIVHRFVCWDTKTNSKRHYTLCGPHGERVDDLKQKSFDGMGWRPLLLRFVDRETGDVIEARSVKDYLAIAEKVRNKWTPEKRKRAGKKVQKWIRSNPQHLQNLSERTTRRWKEIKEKLAPTPKKRGGSAAGKLLGDSPEKIEAIARYKLQRKSDRWISRHWKEVTRTHASEAAAKSFIIRHKVLIAQKCVELSQGAERL